MIFPYQNNDYIYVEELPKLREDTNGYNVWFKIVDDNKKSYVHVYMSRIIYLQLEDGKIVYTFCHKYFRSSLSQNIFWISYDYFEELEL